MIELRNLTKSYVLANGHRRYIFRNLTFTFPEGSNIGLIGRNGAGKSTLLRLIGGIDVPDHGRVVSDKRISWPVGLSGALQGSLTGRDMVKFVCRIYGTTAAETREKLRFVQDFAEIGDYFDQPVRLYSSGMRSRLNFGLSMAFEFDYYLIDEVMAVGDAEFKKKSKVLLKQKLSTSNVILVTHSMDEIAKLCNVVVLVQDGQAILYDDVADGIEAYQHSGGSARRRSLIVKRRGPGAGNGRGDDAAGRPNGERAKDRERVRNGPRPRLNNGQAADPERPVRNGVRNGPRPQTDNEQPVD